MRKNNRHQKWKRKRSHKHKCKKQQVLPDIHVKDFEMSDNNDDNKLSFDTYSIPFVIHNYATAIICNVRKIFIGPVRQANIVVKTADGLSSKARYIGTMQTNITNDENENISYDVPGCVYDP